MSDGILATYLLGYDEAREENHAKIKTEFADGDNRADKVGPVDLRFDVAPKEAIDYFKRKKIIPKKEFSELEADAKSAAFTVGGIYKEDILRAFKDEIQGALETGKSQKALVKNFKNILAGAGHKELGDFHLETVARTNMMIAYGVGRRRQMEDVSDLLPFWEYSAVGDDRTRPTHRACDGIILPADNPFWDTHFPPVGFNCRCTIIARLDVPDGYDLTKPNADTTIALDKNGIPRKAEYGTTVLELDAGKFAGIPKRNTGLKDTFETISASKKAKGNLSKETPIEPKTQIKRDNYRTPKHILEEAQNIAGETVEFGRWYDELGYLLQSQKGKEDHINWQIESIFADQYQFGIRLHNHPRTNEDVFESFSLVDIIVASQWELTEELMVTPNYIYSMRPPVEGWESLGSNTKKSFEDGLDEISGIIEKTYEENHKSVVQELQKKIDNGQLLPEHASQMELHETWKRVAKKLGLRYNRKKLRSEK